MIALTAVQTQQPDYAALAIVAVLVIVVVIMAIRKRSASKKPAVTPVEAPVQETAKEKVLAPGSAGEVKLHTVDPRTAAMLMAIVAEKMDKPLNELRFISIREVE